MERNSTNENFEQFLRQNAEDFRMHPSSKVWDGISKNINRDKRRFYFGLILLLVSSSIAGYTVFEYVLPESGKTNRTISTPPSTQKTSSVFIDQPANTYKTAQINKKVINSTPIPNRTIEAVPAGAEVTNILIGEKERERWFANALTAYNKTTLLNPSLSPDKPVFDFNKIKKEFEEQENPTKQAPAKTQRKNNRLEWMFFFAPTISYRKLTENKSYLRSSSAGAAFNYTALYDVNNVVTHKPDIGLEFGATTKYSLTKNIKLRAGLQFNINRYDIKAFKYVPEIATIALNTRYRVDSLSTMSNYRNFNGGKTDWLQNFYFQISAPVGVEVKLHGNDKMHIGVASTVQPTYVIGDRAYLITSDYKNYAQVPWLIRRWNVNTNLETFVAYSTNKVKWQVGPQVRYQLLSSFVSEYPVKENLFDFGFKVGVSLNQNK